jgi:RNA polymerase sigma-70 factor (ECF subfamily)
MAQGDQASFLELVAGIRPELHRYCARMTGSVIDGEDVLQEILLKTFAALPQLAEVANVRGWVFRLAHNQAVDRFRSYEQRSRMPLDALGEQPDESELGAQADETLAREQAISAAISRFLELPPLQRSSVILKDVLDHSLDEIAEMLVTTVPAVQAALHRARRRLTELQRVTPEPEPKGAAVSPTLTRYAALFNAHDWDALRELLADDVRLEVVARFEKRGRSQVGSYFGHYAGMPDWRVAPGWLDHRQVLAVFRKGGAEPAYFIEIGMEAGRVVSIRDFHHVPYVVSEVRIDLAPLGT